MPIEKKPLFQHIYPHLAPLSSQVIEKVKETVKSGTEKGKKLFKNSLPATTSNKDSIKATFSAVKRSDKPRPADIDKIPEDYTVEERALLQKILRESK